MQGPQGPAGVITLPNGEKSIPVTSVPANESLVVDQAHSRPNPIRSQTEPFTVRIKVKDTRGFVVRDALVFFRSTPLVTQNAQDQRTGQDGWLHPHGHAGARLPGAPQRVQPPVLRQGVPPG